MSQCNGKSVPTAAGTQLKAPDTDDRAISEEQATRYRSAVGDLRYMVDSTRPDMAFVTGRLSMANKTPTQRHQAILKSMLRYVQTSRTHGIQFRRSTQDPISYNHLDAYSDADFAGEHKKQRSTTGSVILYNGAPVSWRSKLQKPPTLSTAEAEYIAATDTLRLAIFVTRLQSHILRKPRQTPSLYIDNQPAIQMMQSLGGTKLRRFIDIKHNYIQDILERKTVKLEHIPTNRQLADGLTKALKRQPFASMLHNLNIRPPYKYQQHLLRSGGL